MQLSGTSHAIRDDLPRKALFLKTFEGEKVVGTVLTKLNIPRKLFRAWIGDDEVFREEFSDACEQIDDELLSLALMSAGVLKKKKGGCKLIDKTILLALLKRHSRLRDDSGDNRASPAIVINIKGADPQALLRVVGGEKAKPVLMATEEKLLDDRSGVGGV